MSGLGKVPTDILVDELVSRYKTVVVLVSNEGNETLDDDYESRWFQHTEDDTLGALGLCIWGQESILSGLIEEPEEESDDA